MILALLVSPASAYDVTVNAPYSSSWVYGNSANGSGDVNAGCGIAASTNAADNNGNTVTVRAGVGNNGDVYGTYWNTTDANVTNNTVTITGNGSVAGYVFGGTNSFIGSSTATTISGNRVIINTTGLGTVVRSIYGGAGDGAATVTGNHVTIQETNTGAVAASVCGGSGSDGTVTFNTVTIQGSGNVGAAYGGNAGTGTVTDNTVYIGKDSSGNGTYTGMVNGASGVIGGISNSGTAERNHVFISGGTVTGNIYGGYVTTGAGKAINNTVNISTSGATYKDIYGGGTYNSTGDLFTGNTLNIHTSGITAANVYNFENLNFYLPSALMSSTTPILTVTGTANLTDGGGNVTGSRSSKVNVDIDVASSPLKKDDQVVLIDATTLVTNGDLDTTINVHGTQGVSLQYEFGLDINPTQLVLKVTQVELNPQTKSFSEARLSQLAFTNQGSDLVAGQGLSAALDSLDTAARRMKKTTVFGALSGGSSRYKTGSHSDVTGLSLITGLAGNSRLAHGKLTLGAFFEYGNANYDSYNSFVNTNSVHGKGKTDYTGGGVLAHLEFNPAARGNAWLESSARFGRATVDFQTNDMTGNLGKRTAFDSDSNYAAAHIGTGYHWKLTKQNGFDLYAQYLWSRQNADTVTLTTGDTVKFEMANSERLRLGSRFIYNLNPHRRAHAGIAWEHEFDGEANANISGFQLDTPKLTGDTCKLELGLTLQPTKTCPLTRNFGIQGYTGKREGIAGSVEVRWEF